MGRAGLKEPALGGPPHREAPPSGACSTGALPMSTAAIPEDLPGAAVTLPPPAVGASYECPTLTCGGGFRHRQTSPLRQQGVFVTARPGPPLSLLAWRSSDPTPTCGGGFLRVTPPPLAVGAS